MALVAGMRLGKYELRKLLGQGGFGQVFLGYDTDLEREVALKFMHVEHTTNPEILRRFLQEARSAAKIAHPGIVTVFECSQIANTGTAADGMAFIAMELLHGESLADRLQRMKRLPAAAAMEIGRQVAIALEAAHRAGIIHRDLKPDNIFLVTDPAMPGGERVKVLDFGIAKLAQPPSGGGVQTHSQMIFGTPRYMSPEQCRSAANIDHRSDIYTLGCILFELVTGAPPFDGEVGELIAKHQMVAPPTARSINPDVPVALDELISKTLAKTPGERPQTMVALARALETGGSSAGTAETLLPDAGESLPRFSAEHPARAGVATTLGAASMSAVSAPAKRSKTGPMIAAVAAVAIGAGIFIATRSSDDSKPQAMGASGEAPKPPPPPVTVKEIETAIDSTPAAEVYLMPESRLVGETPYRGKRAPGEGMLVFVLKAPGFVDQRVVMPADTSTSKTIELVAIAEPAGSGSAKPVTIKPTIIKPVIKDAGSNKPTAGSGSSKPKPSKPPTAGSNGHIDVYPED